MRSILTVIGCIVFVFIVGRSIWGIYSIWQAPKCNPLLIEERCYHSFLNDNPSLDLLVYLSDNSKTGKFNLSLWLQEFDYRNQLEKVITISIPKTVRQNGTLFVHTLIIPSKHTSKYPNKAFQRLLGLEDVTYIKGRLTKYAIPQSATFNLLKEESSLRKKELRPVSHLRSRYCLIMCTEELHLPHGDIPYEIGRLLRINPKMQFLPLASQDFLNMRLKDLVEVTPDSESMNFTFIYTPISLGKNRFCLQMEETIREFVHLGFTEKDLDEVKGVFGDTNLYLLCATMAIGSIHLLLDFLSFKNDVSFWKSQKSMAGLSTRTVLWRAFSQLVVFLFLLDEGTSLLVLVPAGVAALIEVWKVTKVCKTNMKISWKGVAFQRDSTESAAEAETRKYDEECMNYLSYLLYPLCLAAAFYSLLYQPHKSWYSWTINSLVNGVYAFGFLFMLPQLFINYRLKSVAALPWRAFTYRAFNTFIDDIFAFIITMPTAHRVACLRDDVVFLVYLYQRWLYPVDVSRTDEGGGEVALEGKQKQE
ncbi:lipid scramblase CLPTM1L [Euwallacea fornicatus]|uniref:lipid scramblase CLPTM1L n=1 Tax=Euwallacea fornicatus TaxID=995702 RepID=UPI00338F5708